MSIIVLEQLPGHSILKITRLFKRLKFAYVKKYIKVASTNFVNEIDFDIDIDLFENSFVWLGKKMVGKKRKKKEVEEGKYSNVKNHI